MVGVGTDDEAAGTFGGQIEARSYGYVLQVGSQCVRKVRNRGEISSSEACFVI